MGTGRVEWRSGALMWLLAVWWRWQTHDTHTNTHILYTDMRVLCTTLTRYRYLLSVITSVISQSVHQLNCQMTVTSSDLCLCVYVPVCVCVYEYISAVLSLSMGKKCSFKQKDKPPTPQIQNSTEALKQSNMLCTVGDVLEVPNKEPMTCWRVNKTVVTLL